MSKSPFSKCTRQRLSHWRTELWYLAPRFVRDTFNLVILTIRMTETYVQYMTDVLSIVVSESPWKVGAKRSKKASDLFIQKIILSK